MALKKSSINLFLLQVACGCRGVKVGGWQYGASTMVFFKHAHNLLLYDLLERREKRLVMTQNCSANQKFYNWPPPELFLRENWYCRAQLVRALIGGQLGGYWLQLLSCITSASNYSSRSLCVSTQALYKDGGCLLKIIRGKKSTI